MASKTFSNTRTKATWKPRVNEDDLPFYEREDSREAFLGLGDETPAFLSDPGRNPVFNLPYADAGPDKKDARRPKPECGEDPRNGSAVPPKEGSAASADEGCAGESHAAESGGTLQRVQLLGLDELPDGVFFDYSIVGGYNNNAVELSWRIDDAAYSLQWAALKTFTGMQLKYVTPKKRSPLIFALADEDAYVYCDESPCLECVFMCKRGFVLYAHVNGLGTAKIPLTRASAYWESRS